MSDWNEAIQRMHLEQPPVRVSNVFVASEHELDLLARAHAAGRLEGIREAAEVAWLQSKQGATHEQIRDAIRALASKETT